MAVERFDADKRYAYLHDRVTASIEDAVRAGASRSRLEFEPCQFNREMFTRLEEAFTEMGFTVTGLEHFDPYSYNPAAPEGISVRGWDRNDR